MGLENGIDIVNYAPIRKFPMSNYNGGINIFNLCKRWEYRKRVHDVLEINEVRNQYEWLSNYDLKLILRATIDYYNEIKNEIIEYDDYEGQQEKANDLYLFKGIVKELKKLIRWRKWHPQAQVGWYDSY